MKGDLGEIRAGLQARIHELCRQLLPRGRLESGQWVSVNPTVAGDDRKIPALKIRVSGGDVGAWTDHRNGRDGHKGDVIGLVAYINRTDTKGALAWSRDFLGLKTMSRAEREAMRFAAEARRKAAERQAEQNRRWKLEQGEKLFLTPRGHGTYGPALVEGGTRKLGEGSVAEAHARAYFAARQAALEEISTLNRLNFRFSGGTEYWTLARWETVDHRKIKVEDGPLYPAIHAAMRSPTGIGTACHVTFLDRLAPAKAPVSPPKLMFGEKKGSIIELAMGPSGKPFWQTEEPGCVVICEGIETGASLAPAAEHDARVWPAGDINNMGEAPVHLPCVAEIIVARDNNHGNLQAQKQFDAALERLERAGKPIAIMASHVGDDFNDLATGKDE